jgi:integrase
MESRGITEGPLFRRVDSSGRIAGQPPLLPPRRRGSQDGRLTGPGVWHIVKRAAERAGLNSAYVQAHSLRAGGATGAYLGGADLLTISRHGGWKDGSQVVTRYIRDVDAWEKNAMNGAGL